MPTMITLRMEVEQHLHIKQSAGQVGEGLAEFCLVAARERIARLAEQTRETTTEGIPSDTSADA